MKKKTATSDEAAYGDDEPRVEAVTPDSAFKDSVSHQLNGTKLEPFTIERQWASDSIGLRWGRLSPMASEQFGKDNTYPGMVRDTAIIMWLCSVTDDEEIRCACRDPSEAETKAIKFAEKHKIASSKQPEFWKAYRVYLDIMTELHVAYGEPEKKTENQKTVTKT